MNQTVSESEMMRNASKLGTPLDDSQDDGVIPRKEKIRNKNNHDTESQRDDDKRDPSKKKKHSSKSRKEKKKKKHSSSRSASSSRSEDKKKHSSRSSSRSATSSRSEDKKQSSSTRASRSSSVSSDSEESQGKIASSGKPTIARMGSDDDSLSDESLIEDAPLEAEISRPPSASIRPRTSYHRDDRQNSRDDAERRSHQSRQTDRAMDRQKKELVNEFLPDQFLAVQRKPYSSTSETREPQLPPVAEEPPKSNSFSNSGDFSTSRYTRTPTVASLDHRREGSDSVGEMDRYKKEMMQELLPDQFMAVPRKRAPLPKLGGPPAEPLAKPGAVPMKPHEAREKTPTIATIPDSEKPSDSISRAPGAEHVAYNNGDSDVGDEAKSGSHFKSMMKFGRRKKKK